MDTDIILKGDVMVVKYDKDPLDFMDNCLIKYMFIHVCVLKLNHRTVVKKVFV